MWSIPTVILIISAAFVSFGNANNKHSRHSRHERDREEPHFAVYSLTQTSPNYLSIWLGNSSGLTYVTQVATGGNGSSVQSQNPLVVFQHYIFAVNSESSTISMFSIDEHDPTDVTLVGTVPSGGDYPVSITAAQETCHGSLVCVVNSGENNGIACFRFNSNGLYPVAGTNVSLNLNLTTPPENHKGPGQISFTRDGKALVIVVKGENPPLYIYTLESKYLANSSDMGSVNFAFAFGDGNSVVVVDADPYNNGSGIIRASFNVNERRQHRGYRHAPPAAAISFSTERYFLIPNQTAACWVVRSDRSGFYYVANAGSKTVTELTLNRHNNFEVLDEYNLGSGPTDLGIVTLDNQEYLLVNAGGSIDMLKLPSSTRGQATQVASITRDDGGGQGIATFVAQPKARHGHF